MSNKLITVFTPTYNRAHTLKRTYESLCRQTCDDFEWLIVDDGSTDETENIVKSWILENKIPLRYIKKENGGLFTGYNCAIENIFTELNVCIDSDDWMPNDAITHIKSTWESVKCKGVAGIIGLDFLPNNIPNGGKFIKEDTIYFHEQKTKLKHIGDTKIVCRTDLMKQVGPMPSFGEKNFNPVWYYLKIGEVYKFWAVNHNYCYVDYQEDGMGAKIFQQYYNSPKSFAELRKIYMKSKHLPWRRKFVDAAHYISSSIFARDKKFLLHSPKPLMTFFALPLGLAFNIYIRLKNRVI